MLVNYKNLKNNRITEEEDLFVDQLYQLFPDASEIFIRASVNCIQNAIFREVKIGIVKRGADTDPEVTADTKNFLHEIKKFSQDPNHYDPNIQLNFNGFEGRSLKFLLRANSEDLAEFARSYNTKIPDVSREYISEVVGFIFDAMRKATERGLDGERCQTRKARIAEETWNNQYLGNENTRAATTLNPIEPRFFGGKKIVTFKDSAPVLTKKDQKRRS